MGNQNKETIQRNMQHKVDNGTCVSILLIPRSHFRSSLTFIKNKYTNLCFFIFSVTCQTKPTKSSKIQWQASLGATGSGKRSFY